MLAEASSFDEPIPQSWQAGAISESPSPWLKLFPHPGDSLRLHPTQLSGPPKLFPAAFSYGWPVVGIVSEYPKICQKSSTWPQHALYHVAPGLALAAASLGLQLGLTRTPPSPAQVAAVCRSLCSSSRLALGRTKQVAELDLYLPEGPRASVPNGQL